MNPPRKYLKACRLILVAGTTLLIVSLALGQVSTARAGGIAGPDQTIAEGLLVLLGDPAKSGTDPADTDPGATYRWRQIVIGSEPYVKLSHIDKTTTMFIAPEVSSDTRFRFGLKKTGRVEEIVDITVVQQAGDSPSNTTFIDHRISTATCDSYDPTTRACGSGTYKAQKSIFRTAFYPAPTPGWRYVWREGTYSYTKGNPMGATGCWPTTTPVVRIEGPNAANGTPTAPIQFKGHKNGSTYEPVTISMGTATDCATNGVFWVAGSSYVIVEGFELIGNFATSTVGWQLLVGGSGYGAGGVAYTNAPAHHVTIRHVVAHDTAGPNNFRAQFSIWGPSHEIALQYVRAYNGGAGFQLGVSHEKNKGALPYNIFLHTVVAHDNVNHPGNSSGIMFTGARNSACYRCVGYRNADGGVLNSQGPHLDSNTMWDSVAFGQDSSLSPRYPAIQGNERGVQIGTINPGLGMNPPYYRAAAYNRVYRSLIFDNRGNGLNDVGGSVDGRYYHLTVFNNVVDHAHGYAGIGFDSYAGANRYPGSPAPGATLANSISYHHPNTQGDLSIATHAGPNTTLITNLPMPKLWPAPLGKWTNALLATSPGFVVATPKESTASALTTDTNIYSNAATRTLNPNFGAVFGLTLRSGSVAIDAGTFILGVHCDRADDDASPYPASDPNCLHWKGRAPDIGAYEYGIDVRPLPPLSASPKPSAPFGLQVR